MFNIYHINIPYPYPHKMAQSVRPVGTRSEGTWALAKSQLERLGTSWNILEYLGKKLRNICLECCACLEYLKILNICYIWNGQVYWQISFWFAPSKHSKSMEAAETPNKNQAQDQQTCGRDQTSEHVLENDRQILGIQQRGRCSKMEDDLRAPLFWTYLTSPYFWKNKIKLGILYKLSFSKESYMRIPCLSLSKLKAFNFWKQSQGDSTNMKHLQS